MENKTVKATTQIELVQTNNTLVQGKNLQKVE